MKNILPKPSIPESFKNTIVEYLLENIDLQDFTNFAFCLDFMDYTVCCGVPDFHRADRILRFSLDNLKDNKECITYVNSVKEVIDYPVYSKTIHVNLLDLL